MTAAIATVITTAITPPLIQPAPRGRLKRFTVVAGRLICCLLLLSGAPTQAHHDQENAVLARLLAEVQALHRLINAAEKTAATDKRQRFDYSALRRDTALMAEGIRDHLTRVRRDPHTLLPLSGAYRQ